MIKQACYLCSLSSDTPPPVRLASSRSLFRVEMLVRQAGRVSTVSALVSRPSGPPPVRAVNLSGECTEISIVTPTTPSRLHNKNLQTKQKQSKTKIAKKSLQSHQQKNWIFCVLR